MASTELNWSSSPRLAQHFGNLTREDIEKDQTLEKINEVLIHMLELENLDIAPGLSGELEILRRTFKPIDPIRSKCIQLIDACMRLAHPQKEIPDQIEHYPFYHGRALKEASRLLLSHIATENQISLDKSGMLLQQFVHEYVMEFLDPGTFLVRPSSTYAPTSTRDVFVISVKTAKLSDSPGSDSPAGPSASDLFSASLRPTKNVRHQLICTPIKCGISRTPLN